MNETGLTPQPRSLDSSVAEFVGENENYYSRQFSKIQGKNGFVFSWNMMAALLGPLWGAFRGLWGFFWTFLILELFALVQVGRGLWGELGADQISRYERLLVNIGKREQQAAELVAAGKAEEAEAKLKIAENLKKVAATAQEKAELAASEATSILIFGLGLLILIDTPWPVVMLVIVVMAFRLAGPRVAIFTAASLLYLAFMGLWKISMITVALIGAGAFLCILFGIPLGIWFGKSNRAYAMAEPVLDFMQTMPAFVYLIPIIAFFGTGKPPGVLATIIFAMPPVIRLTALGMRGVPEATKEAATAFGCSKWQLLRNVEIPLAMPSIMTGINQTILMSLSMVVIASLIGAEGLGALILEALQYAAKGQGLLGGLAILVCAMVIDRIAQGMYRRKVAGN